MIEFHAPLKQIEEDFEQYGIPTDEPGFYDHQSFLNVEKSNPEYLNNYARYVQARPYSESYLDRARAEIPTIVEALRSELEGDGRKGACVDLSGVLSRILERQGLWNFCVKGSLTISYPEETGIGKRFYWSVDEGEFTAGHAWICAPPYSVIDLTLSQQQAASKELKLLPRYVLAEKTAQGNANVEDILSPAVRQYLLARGVPAEHQLNAVNPTIEQFLDTFKTHCITENGVSLKYVPVAVGAPDSPLEEMIGISTEGRSAIEIYRQVVLPELEKKKSRSQNPSE